MNLFNISIIELLPPNLARDKNVRMACEAFDEELRRIIADIPGIAVMPNLVRKQITDNLLLDLLAWQFHVDFYDVNFPIEKKQEIILKSLDWHTRKGTPSVVEEVVSTVFSRANTQEWFEYGGLPYRFRVETDEELPDTEAINKLTRLIKSVKNSRSILEKITETNNFDDVVETTDEDEKTVRRTAVDYASQVIFRNGRVFRDGSTVLDTQLENVFRDGTHYRNGALERNRTRRVPAVGAILPPLYRRSGVQDLLAVGFNEGNYLDNHHSQALRNGAFMRNGFLNRSRYAPCSANDVVHIEMKYHYFRDGTRVRNGSIQRKGMVIIPLE